MTAAIRVLLVDDHALVREGLRQILEDSPGVSVVGQTGDGAQALALAEKTSPDVIVLDYSMPGKDAPSVIADLPRHAPLAKILVLTVHENIHYAVKALECGAHGYLIKSAAVQELLDAIRAVHEGEVYISPKISQRILAQLRSPKRQREGIQSLSPQEFEVLRLLGSGLSLKEVARRLDVTVSTASTYRARLMEKLALHTTAEIIRYALEQEIVG